MPTAGQSPSTTAIKYGPIVVCVSPNTHVSLYYFNGRLLEDQIAQQQIQKQKLMIGGMGLNDYAVNMAVFRDAGCLPPGFDPALLRRPKKGGQQAGAPTA